MLCKVQDFHNRKHREQSRGNADQHSHSLSGQVQVCHITSIDGMITRWVDATNPNPSLHKGDADDFTPIQEVERIQN